MKKLSLFALLAFLAGCGNYFSVRVPYQFPDMPGVAAAGPAMELLDSWADTFSHSEDRLDGSKEAGDWYADNEGNLFGAVTARLVARYSGRPVERFRPVFRKKRDKDSEEAGRLAQRNSWAKAEEIWLRRDAAGGGWRDSLGLAVSAELKKDYAAAAGSEKGPRSCLFPTRPPAWTARRWCAGWFMSS